MLKKDKITGKFLPGNRSGQMITSEMARGNQHAKGNPPNATSFKPGHLPHNWKGGLQKSGRDGMMVYSQETKTRMPRGKYNWIQANGELPKGYVIYHKDGDKFNDDIDNLEAITRAELLSRNNRRS